MCWSSRTYSVLSRHKLTAPEPHSQRINVWPFVTAWPGLSSAANLTVKISHYCAYFLLLSCNMRLLTQLTRMLFQKLIVAQPVKKCLSPFKSLQGLLSSLYRSSVGICAKPVESISLYHITSRSTLISSCYPCTFIMFPNWLPFKVYDYSLFIHAARATCPVQQTTLNLTTLLLFTAINIYNQSHVGYP
jgi:hypothetical protein